MPDELQGAIYISSSYVLNQVPQLLQLLRRLLQHCCPVKLLKCFVDYETSPDLKGGDDDD